MHAMRDETFYRKQLSLLQDPQALRRRQLLGWALPLLQAGLRRWLPIGFLASSPFAGARDGPVKLLDVNAGTLERFRAYDATPSWFTSGNWGNGQYKPWTDYLVGRITEAEFDQVCAAPSSYCLRDVWNLRRRDTGPIRWALEDPGFNWPGIHALALRFFRTGDSIYLDKWLVVVRSFAQWTLARPATLKAPLERGQPGPLLEVAMGWGGIVTAMGILAKGLDGASERGSPYAPVAARALPTIGPTGLTAQALAVGLADIAAAFSQGDARLLAHHYASARYVPNQRVFGLEALAQMAAFFPNAPGLDPWAPATHVALLDAAQRYSMADGGQVEASFNYAQALVQCLERCAKLPFCGRRRERAQFWPVSKC